MYGELDHLLKTETVGKLRGVLRIKSATFELEIANGGKRGGSRNRRTSRIGVRCRRGRGLAASNSRHTRISPQQESKRWRYTDSGRFA